MFISIHFLIKVFRKKNIKGEIKLIRFALRAPYKKKKWFCSFKKIILQQNPPQF